MVHIKKQINKFNILIILKCKIYIRMLANALQDAGVVSLYMVQDMHPHAEIK